MLRWSVHLMSIQATNAPQRDRDVATTTFCMNALHYQPTRRELAGLWLYIEGVE